MKCSSTKCELQSFSFFSGYCKKGNLRRQNQGYPMEYYLLCDTDAGYGYTTSEWSIKNSMFSVKCNKLYGFKACGVA